MTALATLLEIACPSADGAAQYNAKAAARRGRSVTNPIARESPGGRSLFAPLHDWLGLVRRRAAAARGARKAESRDARAGFCAAPWVEAVLRVDGNVLPCCHNDHRYGSLGAGSLRETWHSPAARDFRKRIAHGEYPIWLCAECHRKGKSTTLEGTFNSLVAQHWSVYEASCTGRGSRPDPQLCRLVQRFNEDLRRDRRTWRARLTCRRLMARLRRVIEDAASVDARRSLAKLRTIARACLDFMMLAEAPAAVATRRQVNLVSICNARCVHCIGLYTGEIVRGAEVDDKRFKRMPAPLAERAFAHAADMTSFFMNGSEFLLHPQWREFAQALANSGVRLAMSTNGMLLDSRAADTLLGSGGLLDINLSFDGATRATVERIRDNVSFDKLVAHTRHFLQRSADATNTKSICMSMVLMQSNVGECADFVRLACSLRPDRASNLHVAFELLNSAPNAAYREFYAREWIDITSPVARARLAEAAEVAERAGMPAFYGGRPLPAALLEAARGGVSLRPSLELVDRGADDPREVGHVAGDDRGMLAGQVVHVDVRGMARPAEVARTLRRE
jgi:MoaA/NifB/PqqE/SkfB family radical SAM enzyme